jgi:demethylmenaquinone methyltransferase/2-methoxy-6-polyprenyl-1,4-benzoquinol methylase
MLRRQRDDRSEELAPDHAAVRGGSFNATVRRMFDAIAPSYDAFNRAASLGLDQGWRRAAIRELAVPEGGRVLDVATGTGDLALAAAARGARVVGCDVASEMIALARRKARAASDRTPLGPGDRPAFHVARAEWLPYAERSFDGVTSAFAMRNVLPVLDDVLDEVLRVLRPGGRMVILEFSEPRARLLRFGHGLYTRRLVPWIGACLTGDRRPFRYLERSIAAWEDPDRFERRIAGRGFVSTGYRRLGLGAVSLHWGERPPE